MKGKNTFTQYEIEQLKALIKERVQAKDRDKQRHIRNKMRAIGFCGRDDFGIKDCQLSDFENLIKSGRIKVLDYGASTPRAKKVVTTNIEPVGSNNSKIGLKPWVGENPKVLILGSLPGDESLKQQAYYCNKGNFFWRIMHNLFG